MHRSLLQSARQAPAAAGRESHVGDSRIVLRAHAADASSVRRAIQGACALPVERCRRARRKAHGNCQERVTILLIGRVSNAHFGRADAC